MFVTLWEFEVKSGSEELFERTYGPAGEWVPAVPRLLRDAKHERVYVTMDLWDSQEAYQEFREKYAKDYAEIDRKCEGLTVTEEPLGRVLSVNSMHGRFHPEIMGNQAMRGSKIAIRRAAEAGECRRHNDEAFLHFYSLTATLNRVAATLSGEQFREAGGGEIGHEELLRQAGGAQDRFGG